MEEIKPLKKEETLSQKAHVFYLVILMVLVFIESIYVLRLFDDRLIVVKVLSEKFNFLIGYSNLANGLILIVVALLIIGLFMLLKRIRVSVKLVKRFQLVFLLLVILTAFLLLKESLHVFSKEGLDVLWFTGLGAFVFVSLFGMICYFCFVEYIVFGILAWFVLPKEERENEKV